MKHSRPMLTVLKRIALVAPVAVALPSPSPVVAQQRVQEPQNVPVCPARAPRTGQRCTTTGDRTTGESDCRYSRMICECNGTPRVAHWQCFVPQSHPQRGPLPPPELESA